MPYAPAFREKMIITSRYFQKESDFMRLNSFDLNGKFFENNNVVKKEAWHYNTGICPVKAL